MDSELVEKKLKKLGTKDLESKSIKESSIDTLKIIQKILQNRESKLDVELLILRREADQHLDLIVENNCVAGFEQVETILGETDSSAILDLIQECKDKEILRKILSAPVKDGATSVSTKKTDTSTSKKTTSPKPSSKKAKSLSDEDTEKIKSILDSLADANKKEIVITLLNAGFTKQQLDKYRPEIAHWSYIYELSNQLEK